MKYFRLLTMLSICALIISACAMPGSPTTPSDVKPTSSVDDVLATVTPASPDQPQASATAPTGGKLISRNGVEFTLPAGLGTDATGSIIPEIVHQEDGPPNGNPAYMQFKLQAYPVQGDEYFYAEVQVYEAKAYAVDSANGTRNITYLEALLTNPDAELTQKAMPPTYLQMASNMKRISSASVKGVRMLSVRGNGMPLVTNGNLSYQFHGLTADEKFYIIVNLLLTAPFLPAKFDSPAADGIVTFPQDGDMNIYLADVAKRLEIAEISGTLSPAPALMDQLVQSIKINSSEIILPAPLPTHQPGISMDEAAATADAASAGGTPTNAAPCYAVEFVKDVTYPDGTQVNAGEAFTKTWSIKNTGSCTWDGNFTLVFMKGDQMGGVTPTVALAGNSVAPGGVVDVSVPMTAPTEAGTYLGYWALYNAAGERVLMSYAYPFEVTVNIVVK